MKDNASYIVYVKEQKELGSHQFKKSIVAKLEIIGEYFAPNAVMITDKNEEVSVIAYGGKLRTGDVCIVNKNDVISGKRGICGKDFEVQDSMVYEQLCKKVEEIESRF